MSLRKDIIKLAFGKKELSVQNPLPTDGDSVYAKDIWVDESDIGNFSGEVTDLFDGLHSENTDSTSDNPKSYFIHFYRTIVTPLVGIGSSQGGTFSNVKIIGLLSGMVEVVLADFSSDNTLRTTQTFTFPNAGVNALKIEFYTTNEIAITNIYIPKLIAVTSIIESAVVYGSSYNSTYLLNGTSQDMNVDGSTTPVDFKYTIPTGITAKWNRSFIDLADGSQEFQPDNFGELAGLTNGVDIIIVKSSVEYILENWKTNMDISMTMYDFTSPYKVGAYSGRWTMKSDIGDPITLYTGDEVILRVNDDLTGLDSFRFRLKLKQ